MAWMPMLCDSLPQVKLGERIDVPVFEMGTSASPDEIAAKGVAQAKKVPLQCSPSSCRVACKPRTLDLQGCCSSCR